MPDTNAHHTIIAALVEKLRAGYVYPDAADSIVSVIQKHLNDGEYADIDEEAFFAYALTTHLQEFNHDQHLWVKYHPEELPDTDQPSYKHPEWLKEQQIRAKNENFGVRKVERLAGGVGYLEISYLHRPEWADHAIRSAMAALANAPTLILDLRGCTGGYPGTVALLCSYLFREPGLPILRVYWRDEDRTQQFNTQDRVPEIQFLDQPVYTLIGRDTFSAGEALARVLHTRKRAVLVGAKTDGGSHATITYRLHPHFELFLPVGRTFDALTGEEWEGIGVLPDVACAPEQALSVALDMADRNIFST